MSKTNRQYDSKTATSIVIANMVGTGVFTSLGFQLLDIQSAPVILLLWFLGGVSALCGALCYSELSVALPRSGGEYNFISSIYHPGLGFVSGWLSAIIGFAAPTALVAITSGVYLQAIFAGIPVKPFAIGLVLVISLFHYFNRASSSNFQVLFTGAKVLLICFFVAGALILSEQFQDIRWMPKHSDLSLVGNGSFAVALIYVSYAYTGWNAATYLAGEIEDVQTEMPKILVRGTLFVTLLYILLHVVFLLVAPMDAMQGKLEVGFVAASYAFGSELGRWFSLMLCVLLISTASAMIVSGPRTLHTIGQDFALLSFLASENKEGIPQKAILFQLTLTIVLIGTSSFEAILVFSGFALGLNTLMTVLGVWYLRRYHPSISRPFQVPWYPWPMIIFVGLMLWTLIYVVIERPLEGLLALALVAAGWFFYLISQRWEIQE